MRKDEKIIIINDNSALAEHILHLTKYEIINTTNAERNGLDLSDDFQVESINASLICYLAPTFIEEKDLDKLVKKYLRSFSNFTNLMIYEKIKLIFIGSIDSYGSSKNEIFLNENSINNFIEAIDPYEKLLLLLEFEVMRAREEGLEVGIINYGNLVFDENGNNIISTSKSNRSFNYLTSIESISNALEKLISGEIKLQQKLIIANETPIPITTQKSWLPKIFQKKTNRLRIQTSISKSIID